MCYLNMIKIREFEINDYDDVIKLWISSNLPFKPRGRDKYDKIEKEIKNDNSIFLIAEFEGKIIGSVFGTHDGRKGWINRLAISPNFQGKDLAKKLCNNLENRFYNLGIEIIGCLIENWNEKSINYFEKIGFTKHEDIIYFSKRNKIYI
jgi:ribosomal protein S18 acetylase RimI-like enzyme